MPRVLVPIAEGSEELEAISIVDLLRRAEVEVVIAGLKPGPVTMSRQTVIVPDMTLDAAIDEDFDMIALPGGLPGADNLNDSAPLRELLQAMHAKDKFVCAVCAAPYVLANAGVLDGRRATSYPGFLETMDLPEVEISGAPVVRDGNVITSRGPGTAMDFALELIEALCGHEKRVEVEHRLVRPEVRSV